MAFTGTTTMSRAIHGATAGPFIESKHRAAGNATR